MPRKLPLVKNNLIYFQWLRKCFTCARKGMFSYTMENRFLLKNFGVRFKKLPFWFLGTRKLVLEPKMSNFLSQLNKGELKETENKRVIKNYY